MSIQRWTDSDDDFFANPFRALLNPRYFGPSLLTAPNTSLNAASPIKVDVVENADKYIVKADIPGIPKSDVKLSVDGDLLTLAVEAGKDETRDEERKGTKFHRIERSRTFERRVIRLPESADTNSITAKVDQGVLDVTTGKKKAAVKSRQIDIMGGGDSTGAQVSGI